MNVDAVCLVLLSFFLAFWIPLGRTAKPAHTGKRWILPLLFVVMTVGMGLRLVSAPVIEPLWLQFVLLTAVPIAVVLILRFLVRRFAAEDPEPLAAPETGT
ncbi:hypothetical protein [Mycetocola saprophilus]|uniref:hypothetical protein n=1 Tax=Mycetocola saprophilus TaxID=76636 RepID=UPI003BF14E31